MEDPTPTDADRMLSLRLELHLGREPISGRVRTDEGDEQEFVGWLGFVEALETVRPKPEES